ncbi:hypothetical protein LJR153_007365 [Paenibacillus sp. LjRoot153]|uniref:hypothetical protein n=1 Tax=Paenibacillus sp. LjRoot153 TaxID=3342270 RepID=UPI003ECD07EA
MNYGIKRLQTSKWLIQRSESHMQFVEIVSMPTEVHTLIEEYQIKITEMEFGPESSEILEEVKALITEAYAASEWTGYFESAMDNDTLASLLCKYGIAYKQTKFDFS